MTDTPKPDGPSPLNVPSVRDDLDSFLRSLGVEPTSQLSQLLKDFETLTTQILTATQLVCSKSGLNWNTSLSAVSAILENAVSRHAARTTMLMFLSWWHSGITPRMESDPEAFKSFERTCNNLGSGTRQLIMRSQTAIATARPKSAGADLASFGLTPPQVQEVVRMSLALKAMSGISIAPKPEPKPEPEPETEPEPDMSLWPADPREYLSGPTYDKGDDKGT